MSTFNMHILDMYMTVYDMHINLHTYIYNLNLLFFNVVICLFLYFLYVVTLQRSGTRLVTKHLRSMRPEPPLNVPYTILRHSHVSAGVRDLKGK